MAARNKLTQTHETRARIQTSQLINRLENHVFKGLKLESTQLKAIEILLRKTLPDLSQVDANVNVIEKPQARVYPLGLPDEHDRLPAPSEAVDSLH